MEYKRQRLLKLEECLIPDTAVKYLFGDIEERAHAYIKLSEYFLEVRELKDIINAHFSTSESKRVEVTTILLPSCHTHHIKGDLYVDLNKIRRYNDIAT